MKNQIKIMEDYQQKPAEFMKAAWPDIILWDKLLEICNLMSSSRRVAVPSGHGVGKTFIAARIVLWFLFCFYPAKVITTAPTWPQVEKLLWSEITKAYNTSAIPLGGRLLQTDLKIDEEWFATGFSTRGRASERDYGAPKAQGWHSENLLIVLDEAPGVEHEIWISIESLIVGDNNKVLAIGNPTSPTGDFYEACKNPLWQKLNISSFDHPNVKQNKTVVPGAVTKEWIEERRSDWGEDSPLWIAKVLGEFPAEGTDTLIPLNWAEACVNLDLSRDGDRKLGIDVARYGDDMTAFSDIVGQIALPIEVFSKKDTNFTSGKAIRMNESNNYDSIGVDDTGVGGGVTDACEDAGLNVQHCNFGASAIEKDKFENLKAEFYWNLREAIKNKQLSLPDDKVLINQLCSIKYSYTRKGLIKIESKDDQKKRGLKSPDRADALVIAFNAGHVKNLPGISIISVNDED